MHNTSSNPSAEAVSLAAGIDLRRIRREAKRRCRRDGSMTYMQHLDQAAHSLYGVRHFHEAQKRSQHTEAPLSPLQYYLQALQADYLDF